SWFWLLPPAQLHPGARDGAVAHRTRRRHIAPFMLVLYGPGSRPGRLWYWLRSHMAGTDDFIGRHGRPNGRTSVLTAAAASAGNGGASAVRRRACENEGKSPS